MSLVKQLHEMREEMLETRFERRKLLKTLMAGGAAAIGGSLLAGCGGDGTPLTGGGGGGGGSTSDVDVLNFALNLEYLEAEYYLRGTTGSGLSAADAGTGAAAVTGGSKVTFTTPAFRQYAEEIAADELAHVRFLRGALGGNNVPRPAIDLKNSFNAAANAAGLGPTFDPFANEVNFMIGAFIFEDVGVTAYKGGATLISNKTYLEAAAGILGVEAYHAGTVRTVLFNIGGSAISAAQAISNLRDTADGGGDKDQGITSGGGDANIVPADSNGIAFSRTTSEVLKIVYLGGTSSGGFFPNGLNGKIKTAS